MALLEGKSPGPGKNSRDSNNEKPVPFIKELRSTPEWTNQFLCKSRNSGKSFNEADINVNGQISSQQGYRPRFNIIKSQVTIPINNLANKPGQ
ncbi:predicted protein [Sclerotinia sclerotiorum 1980 UF-70]|uniref:Uncharacterized protein n=1 Tax=Sclerotinia sclerotiorum (strain ATCC 18683 / 1980 / Ss-1) TaxID=665079 RepID=A7EH08_SCLS1|nr:predicted protein [Sclerotinia sclerotiorum 1980 UF-70]EDO02124.1 predicted protein [Sclerotinia sclerotiorum 1980 UF-70]